MNDNISRKAAIRWVKTECNPYGKPTLDFESGKKVIEHLEQMPSTDRSGRWIYGEDEVAMCDGYRCDRCGFFVPWDYEHKFIDFINDYHFCPSCGARMRGASDE